MTPFKELSRLDQARSLLSVLLDPTAEDHERDDAAMGLGGYPYRFVVDALIEHLRWPNPETGEYDVVHSSCIESLVEIFKARAFDSNLLRQLGPEAFHNFCLSLIGWTPHEGNLREIIQNVVARFLIPVKEKKLVNFLDQTTEFTTLMKQIFFFPSSRAKLRKDRFDKLMSLYELVTPFVANMETEVDFSSENIELESLYTNPKWKEIERKSEKVLQELTDYLEG